MENGRNVPTLPMIKTNNLTNEYTKVSTISNSFSEEKSISINIEEAEKAKSRKWWWGWQCRWQ